MTNTLADLTRALSATGPAPRRLIAVGVRGDALDDSTLRWALDEAISGRDGVHLVHAFVPLRIEGCSWQPVTEARDARRSRAQWVVARVLQKARLSHPGLDVAGSAVAGIPEDVLAEFSEVVDLEVIGEDEAHRRLARTTTSRLLRCAKCPVAVVPHDYGTRSVDPQLPVTVVVDTLDLPSMLLERGLQEARRRRTSLRVAHVWSALHEEGPWTSELLANRQAQLDMQLADWRGTRPSGGIVGELLVDDGPEALLALRVDSQLFVVSARSTRLLGPIDESVAGRCAVIVMPDPDGT
jgi:nucleotide-binding universal stress UspA family protein